MRSIPGFIPGRLTEARAARRIPSMAALARAMSLNPSTVSRWEDGSSAPDEDGLLRLADFLDVRREFFLRSFPVDRKPVFFRSLSNTLVRDIDYQKAQMRWLQELSHIVEHYVDFPAVDIPDVLNGSSYHQLRDEDIEQIALDLRTHWGLGDGPCTDMLALMERVGFVVGTIEMGTVKLDGLCSWSPVDGRPHVLLANDKMSFARRQMDAAHELAHAILHANVSEFEFERDLRLIEAQAFRLGSAFLLPSTSYPLELRSFTLSNMVSAKERWRVSIKAQIKRLADLELIEPEYATQQYKFYSAKGWSREEPFDRQWELSEPRLLREALNLIVEEGVRLKRDLQAVEFAIAPSDVENLASLPPGWFQKESAEVVQLKPVPKISIQTSAEIVPFPKK